MEQWTKSNIQKNSLNELLIFGLKLPRRVQDRQNLSEA